METFVISSMVFTVVSLLVLIGLGADNWNMRKKIEKLQMKVLEAERKIPDGKFPDYPVYPTKPAYFEGNASGLRTLH
jgi:hypothetical protein